ncbi:hypothetical protein [Actinomycetospora sp. NBRC 106375]|uniref:hypothetical protein n=1 Tax=Actinomycetospora sp. NBRC 106375 TaxID=3032207 RepID=UPI00255286E7|nr:hypothetical protein [Actinomycetospora sp. NBRC 106375]
MTTPREAPPAPVQRSFVLWIAAVVVGLVGSVIGLVTAPPIPDLPGATAGAVTGLGVGVVFLVLFVIGAVKMRQGRHWARLTLAIVGGISVVFTVLGLLLSAGIGVRAPLVPTIANLVQAALIVAAIILSYQAAANPYFRTRA